MYGYGYTDPGIQSAYQARLNQLMQQYPQFANQMDYGQMQQMPQMQQGQQPQQMRQQPMQNQNGQGFLSGRPVTNVDEARGAMISLDGSLNIFTNIPNKKIYTKQIDNDGNAMFNTYVLDETPEPEKTVESDKYADKSSIDDLNNKVNYLNKEIVNLKEALNNARANAVSPNVKGSTEPYAAPQPTNIQQPTTAPVYVGNGQSQ